MEAIIILSILLVATIVLGYVNSDYRQYTKAEHLLREGNKEKAKPILEKLYANHEPARATLAKLHLSEGKVALAKGDNKSAKESLTRAVTISSSAEGALPQLANLNRVSVELLRDIALREAVKAVENGEPKMATILLGDALQIPHIRKDDKDLLVGKLVDIAVQQGRNEEKSKNYQEAIVWYDQGIQYLAESTLPDEVGQRLRCRQFIATVKNKRIPTATLLNAVAKTNLPETEDAFYRLACLRARKKQYQKALYILNTHFPSSTVKAVTDLQALCINRQQRAAAEAAERINSIVFSDDAEAIEDLYHRLDKETEQITSVYPERKKDLEKIPDYLFSKLVDAALTNGDSGKALELIAAYPQFYEDPNLLKNAGIACFAIANQGKLNSSNYQTVISVWLAAVYSDLVLSESLEATTWDDELTFSLENSLGRSESLAVLSLPDNVNYGSASESNISIGETQRELLHSFEGIINQLEDSGDSRIIQAFYQSEHRSLEMLLDHVEELSVYATPHFAHTHDLQNGLLTQLQKRFNDWEDESILEAGLPYVGADAPSLFKQYKSLKAIEATLQQGALKGDLRALRGVNAAHSSRLLSQFTELASDLQDAAAANAQKFAKSSGDTAKAILVYKELLRVFPNCTPLKYHCAESMLDQSIDKVNNEKSGHDEALETLLEAYHLSPDNPRLMRNLAIIAKFNCFDLLNDKISRKGERQLDQLIRVRSEKLKSYLRNEVGEIYSDLINMIKQMDPSTAKLILGKINRGGTSIDGTSWAGYSQPSLNAEGEKLVRKIMKIKSIIE